MFEQHQCVTCDELHQDILKRPESSDMLKQFNIAVINMWSEDKITTPDGDKQKIKDWAKKIDVKYAPSLVYFNEKGEEVFRTGINKTLEVRLFFIGTAGNIIHY